MTILLTDTHVICTHQPGGRVALRKSGVVAVSYLPADASGDYCDLRVVGELGTHFDTRVPLRTAQWVLTWFTGSPPAPDDVFLVQDDALRHEAWETFITTARVAPAPDEGQNGEEQKAEGL